jgi:hypothetical protein
MEIISARIMPAPIPTPLPRSLKAIRTPNNAKIPTPIIAYDLYLGVGISRKDSPIPARAMINVRIPPLWNPFSEALKPNALTVHQGKKTIMNSKTLRIKRSMLGLVDNLISKWVLL